MALNISNLEVDLETTKIFAIHNLFANFFTILDTCKRFVQDLVNEMGNIPRHGVVSRFSDFEVIALNFTAEIMEIPYKKGGLMR